MSEYAEGSPIVLPDDPSFGPEVQVDYPGYRSTRWRAPKRPLVSLPEEFHDLDGPVFGAETVDESDHDLTQGHQGEPLGERIIVSGTLQDEDGRPLRRRADRGLAGERVWQVPPRGRPASRPAGSKLLGRRPLSHRRRRPLPVRDHQARRLPVGEPRERLAPGAHPLLGLRPPVRAAAGHADVLPRRPAVRVRPDLHLGAGPEVARAARRSLRPRRDPARMGARVRVGHRPGRGGSGTTPMENGR